MYKKIIFFLFLGISPFLAYASMAKEGSEKTSVTTLATATAAAGSSGGGAAQKPYNQAKLDERLVEYANRGDIIGVRQQLAKGANPDARTKEGNSVLEKALAARYQKNIKKHGKRANIEKEYRAIAALLVRAGARLRYNHFDDSKQARDWLIINDIFMPNKLSYILYARLYEAVAQGNVIEVRTQLERGAYPYGQDQTSEPVLYIAIDGWLNDRQGKDKEYREITIELLKAHAELFCYDERPYKRPDERLECLPHVVEGIPMNYKQTMYDAQGKPRWLHTFFARALHNILYVSSMEDKGNGVLERNFDVEQAITRCISAILNAGFDITIEIEHSNAPHENIYALMNNPWYYDFFMGGDGGPEKWPRDGTQARKNSFDVVKSAYDMFFKDHQKIVKEGLEQSNLPSPLFDFIYECLYVRPYVDNGQRVPEYVKNLLTGNGPILVCEALSRYIRIGGFIPCTEELNKLTQQQKNSDVQKILDDNESHKKTLRLDDNALREAFRARNLAKYGY